MRAVVYRSVGAPEVIKVTEIDVGLGDPNRQGARRGEIGQRREHRGVGGDLGRPDTARSDSRPEGPGTPRSTRPHRPGSGPPPKVAYAAASSSPPREPPAELPDMSDERAVQEILARYVRAVDARNADDVAYLYVEDGAEILSYNRAGAPEPIAEFAGAAAMRDAKANILPPHPDLGWAHHATFDPIVAIDRNTASLQAQVHRLRNSRRPTSRRRLATRRLGRAGNDHARRVRVLPHLTAVHPRRLEDR
jgi:hypothetical protein